MSWIRAVSSIIAAAFPGSRKPGITPPPGLEGARVICVNQGRAGRVVFTSGLKSFEMYFEFGGVETLAVIDVPPAADWSTRTGFPLGMRQAILEFIGECVVQDQTTRGTGRFEIHEQDISIYI